MDLNHNGKVKLCAILVSIVRFRILKINFPILVENYPLARYSAIVEQLTRSIINFNHNSYMVNKKKKASTTATLDKFVGQKQIPRPLRKGYLP
jgi:hypothetical protein